VADPGSNKNSYF